MIEFHGMRHVALFAHVRPDGDTLGAMFGLRAALSAIGVLSDCFCDSPLPDELRFLDQEDILNRRTAERYDAGIALDCADLARLGEWKTLFGTIAETFNIDHHGTNPGYARHNIVRESASACEIVYDLLKESKIPVSLHTATALYCGILTDTGSFSQANTTPNAHRIAAELVEAGIDVECLHNRLMKVVKREKLMFIADRIQALRSYAGGRISVMTVAPDDLSRFGLNLTDTEGLINYALNIEGVDIAFSLTESEKETFKVSLRCRRGYDVASVAASFGGGGHVQASGCQLRGMREEAVERLVRCCEIALEESDGRHR